MENNKTLYLHGVCNKLLLVMQLAFLVAAFMTLETKGFLWGGILSLLLIEWVLEYLTYQGKYGTYFRSGRFWIMAVYLIVMLLVISQDAFLSFLAEHLYLYPLLLLGYIWRTVKLYKETKASL